MHFRREVPLGSEQCFDLLRRGLVQLRHLFRRDIGPHAPAYDVEMSLQYFGKWGWCCDLHLIFERIRSGGGTCKEGECQHRTQKYRAAAQIGTTEFTKGYDSPRQGLLRQQAARRAIAIANGAAA
jgi:hypothetical protein